MPLLIDAYNVLHTVGVLPPEMAGIELDGLAELIEVSRYRRRKVKLVCDGSPKPGALNQVGPLIRVRYAGSGRTADDEIAWLVATSTHPKRLIVVSTDAAVARAAKKRRARTIRSDTFLHQLVADFEHQSRTALSKSRLSNGTLSTNAQAWLAEFNLTEEDLAIPSSRPTASWEYSKRKNEPDVQDDIESGLDDETIARSNVPPDKEVTAKTDEEASAIHGLPDDIIAEAERITEEDRHRREQ